MDTQETLGAPVSQDEVSFWNYWNRIKSSINTMKNLTGELKKDRWKLMLLKKRAQVANPKLVPQIDEQLVSINEKIMESMTLRQKIDRWVPTFMKIEQASTRNTGLGDIGFLPLILPAWALAGLGIAGVGALAYIATTGMQLVSDYMFQRNVLKSIEKGVYDAEVGAGILKAGQRPGGLFTQWGEGLGKMGSILGIGALLLGILYVFPMTKQARKPR